ncbi:MAG: hypothetical protein PHR00_04040 [Patescibacteria group bacterium]|nr:hypothetical protein [Patescibacteria group bacterium]
MLKPLSWRRTLKFSFISLLSGSGIVIIFCIVFMLLGVNDFNALKQLNGILKPIDIVRAIAAAILARVAATSLVPVIYNYFSEVEQDLSEPLMTVGESYTIYGLTAISVFNSLVCVDVLASITCDLIDRSSFYEKYISYGPAYIASSIILLAEAVGVFIGRAVYNNSVRKLLNLGNT